MSQEAETQMMQGPEENAQFQVEDYQDDEVHQDTEEVHDNAEEELEETAENIAYTYEEVDDMPGIEAIDELVQMDENSDYQTSCNVPAGRYDQENRKVRHGKYQAHAGKRG